MTENMAEKHRSTSKIHTLTDTSAAAFTTGPLSLSIVRVYDSDTTLQQRLVYFCKKQMAQLPPQGWRRCSKDVLGQA